MITVESTGEFLSMHPRTEPRLEVRGQICHCLHATTLTAGSIATLEGFIFGVCDFDDATG